MCECVSVTLGLNTCLQSFSLIMSTICSDRWCKVAERDGKIDKLMSQFTLRLAHNNHHTAEINNTHMHGHTHTPLDKKLDRQDSGIMR